MKVSGLVAIALWSFFCVAQEVQVSRAKGSVVFSVAAQKSYQLLSGQERTPVLTVECAQKGKKSLHVVRFLPGAALAEDNPEVTVKGGQLSFNMTIGGSKQVTTWVLYGDAVSYTYFGKQEPERLRFIQSLLSSGSVSIQFTPFLTGVPITGVFELSKLRDAMDAYPECAMR
jgi:hypothetical protein